MVVSRVGRVFQDVGCPTQAARAEYVLQGGQCATGGENPRLILRRKISPTADFLVTTLGVEEMIRGYVA